MTPTLIREALTTLGWTRQSLADATGYDEKQVRRWESGEYLMPGPLWLWLAKLARYHRAHPPPKKTTRRKKGC